jgi:hypothetical protein
VPHEPFAWESPCLELIFSMRVPGRKAMEDCGVWERMVGVSGTFMFFVAVLLVANDMKEFAGRVVAFLRVCT